jgi:DNA-directed RNA polymerase specialized sigma24 family protein
MKHNKPEDDYKIVIKKVKMLSVDETADVFDKKITKIESTLDRILKILKK